MKTSVFVIWPLVDENFMLYNTLMYFLCTFSVSIRNGNGKKYETLKGNIFMVYQLNYIDISLAMISICMYI